MNNRIIEFLKKENKTSAQFAEEIGVQPSGISHIISGRNKPSLDFVLKMLEKYKYISSDWLLFGKGSMYKEPLLQDLFSDQASSDISSVPLTVSDSIDEKSIEKELIMVQDKTSVRENEVIKIVWFYANNTFEEFYPGKK